MLPGGDSYDPRAALYAFAPGILLTREIEQSLVERYEQKGNLPLNADDVLAITGPLPPIPTSIPYYPPEFF